MSVRSLLAWSWTASILGLCWIPRSMMRSEGIGPGPLGIPHLDKFVHFTLFAGFAFVWAWSIGGKIRAIFLAGVGLAILSELGQMMPIVNRDAGLDDGLADVAGVLAGLGTYALLRRATRSPAA